MSNPPSLAERFGPYDERRMVAHTVLNDQAELLTPFEKNVRLAFLADAKAQAQCNGRFRALMRERFSTSDVERIDAVVAGGFARFVTEVGERLIRERLSETRLNRCPACAKITITPMARWCIWCRHDWHEKS